VTAANSSSSSSSSPSSPFASIVVQIMMMTRQQLYILINLYQTCSNLIKPRRITTSCQNSVSTPPIVDVIPLYWWHQTWYGPTSRQRNVYPPLAWWWLLWVETCCTDHSGKQLFFCICCVVCRKFKNSYWLANIFTIFNLFWNNYFGSYFSDNITYVSHVLIFPQTY
jgi:hypothetical protein